MHYPENIYAVNSLQPVLLRKHQFNNILPVYMLSKNSQLDHACSQLNNMQNIIVPNVHINVKASLVKLMASHRIGSKLIPEPVMTQITDADMCHLVSTCQSFNHIFPLIHFTKRETKSVWMVLKYLETRLLYHGGYKTSRMHMVWRTIRFPSQVIYFSVWQIYP